MSKRENKRLEWRWVNERVQKERRKEKQGKGIKGRETCNKAAKKVAKKDMCYLFNHFILLHTLSVTI